MALAQVLWGVSLLSLIIATVVSIGNNAYISSRSIVLQSEQEAALDAGLSRGIIGLLDGRLDQRWRVDGVEQKFRFNNLDINVAIEDELGRFDLNHVEQQTLVRLLQAAGLELVSAGKLADKILDWREPTSEKRLNGAKARDYEAAGLPQRPRNGPFQSIGELLLVMDMTPEVFEHIKPALTVYSGHQFIDSTVALPEALKAMSSSGQTNVPTDPADKGNAVSGKIPLSVRLGGRSFRITAALEQPGGVETKKSVVIRLTDNTREPYWTLMSSVHGF